MALCQIEEGDEIIKEAGKVISTEQLLYRKMKEELIEDYNRYAKRIEAKNMTPDRKEKLIRPGRSIIALVLEVDNAKRVSSHE